MLGTVFFLGADTAAPYAEYAAGGVIRAAAGVTNTELLRPDNSLIAEVEAQALEGPPDDDLDAWDDVVEFSIDETDNDTEMYPTVLMADEGYDSNEATWLNAHGPGWYRVRAYARGRDAESPGGDEFLVVSWLAPKAMPKILKMTSAYAKQAEEEYDYIEAG